MKLGAYTACLHDKPLEEALEILRDLGLTSAEINAGGFIGTPHLPVDELLESPGAREEYLSIFPRYGIELTAPQLQRQPAAPGPGDQARRGPQADDQAGRVARHQDGDHHVGTSGRRARRQPPVLDRDPLGLGLQGDPGLPVGGGRDPVLDRDRGPAAENDVRVAIEMHPHNLVFNPATMKRLVERTNATHLGAEMDPSHLFWQHIDPIRAVEDLGDLVFFAAAKDTLIHETAAVNGVLDDRFEWIPADQNPLGLGGRLHGHAMARRSRAGRS